MIYQDNDKQILSLIVLFAVFSASKPPLVLLINAVSFLVLTAVPAFGGPLGLQAN